MSALPLGQRGVRMRGSTRGPWWVSISAPLSTEGTPSAVGPRSAPPSTYHVAMSRSGCCTVQPASCDTVTVSTGLQHPKPHPPFSPPAPLAPPSCPASRAPSLATPLTVCWVRNPLVQVGVAGARKQLARVSAGVQIPTPGSAQRTDHSPADDWRALRAAGPERAAGVAAAHTRG